jgi:DNA-binding NarL/FixJ family response regulator/tetratricopeptide (TPR) repeat protein
MIGGMVGRLVSPFQVGRSSEFASGERALDAALAGNPAHLLISGEAGVGKSRLVAELSRSAAERGMRVARGACANLGDGGLPYGPIVDCLRGLPAELDPDDLAIAVGRSGPDLARLVPALAPGIAADTTIQQEWLQARLLEALLGFFQRLAATTPMLLVIEDLHWADPATRQTVAFLARTIRSERLTLAMTFRSDELHRRHPLLPWLAELERSGGVERIDLHRLDLAETRELVAAIEGVPPTEDLATRIHGRSDGNPFFVEELLDAERDGEGAERLPPTLRDVLVARIAAVPETTQAVLGAAAVAGRQIDHDLLAAIAGRSETALAEDLRPAVAGHLLVAARDAGGGEGYTFRHALLQEVVYDDLLPGERRRLHRMCATALAARQTGDDAAATHWSELAHHWSAARDDPAAFHASIRAAEAAEQGFAFSTAQRHYDRVLELWADVPEAEALAGTDRVGVLSRAALAAILSGDGRRSVALRREAARSLDPSIDPVRSAVLEEQLGRALWKIVGDTRGALAAYESAWLLMPTEPPTAARARVLAGYAQMLMLLDRYVESHRLCDEAIEIARTVGAREAEGHALNTLGLDLAVEGRCAEAVTALEQATQIAHEARNADDIGRAYINLTDALLFCGDIARAAQVVDDGIRVCDEFGTTGWYGCYVRQNGVLINHELGRWSRAHQLLAESDAILDSRLVNSSPGMADRYGLARAASLLVGSGAPDALARLDLLEGLIHEGPVEVQFSGMYYIARAEYALWQDRPEEGLNVVEMGLADLASKQTWYWYLVRLHRIGARAAADAAEVGRARRDRVVEQEVLRRAAVLRESRRRTVAASLALPSGAAAEETRAEAATAEAEEGRLAGASDPDAWGEALVRWRARERPYLASYVRWRQAEAYLRLGERAAAEEALSEAASIATDLEARPLLAAIRSLSERSRLRLRTPQIGDAPAPELTPDGEAEAASADPFGLTEREREVLTLVTLGRTNRQIGESLFISGNTAGVHVSNILGKMGASSRAEAAGIAVRLGLADGG